MQTVILFQDCRVIIWTNDGTSNNWTSKVLHKFNDVVWHVSWSVTGNILAVSGGDNKVRTKCRSHFVVKESKERGKQKKE